MRNLMVGFLRSESRLPVALRAFSEDLLGGFPRKERAFLYKKLAECFWRAGEMRLARLNLISALQLNPRLGGAKKIREKLAADRLFIVG